MAIHRPDCLIVGRLDKTQKSRPGGFAAGSDKYL
jgi:hypothetical protein